MSREPPSPLEVRQARLAAGYTQAAAADLVDLSTAHKWSQYERGERRMDWCRWQLFLLLVGLHPKALLVEREDGK